MNNVRNIICGIVICILYIVTVISASNFDFESSDFSKILNTPAFVDKTLFIKTIIENNKTSIITAPPGFGKSTNMNMLKTFLEIEVDSNGVPTTNANIWKDQVNDTKNYKLFYDNMLNIVEETNMMNEYFGRTPVISVSFICNRNIRNFSDVLEFFRDVVHGCFKDYQYLRRSNKLGIDQKQYIETWCDNKNYQMFGNYRVQSGLRDLSEFLYRHFNDKTVYVLIDDYDSVFKRALYHVTDDDQLDEIIRLTMSIINSLMKTNKRHVHGGVITGISDTPMFSSPMSHIENADAFTAYRFLENHQFVEYFGLTKDEVDGLLVYPELQLGENVVNEARKMYGGYKSKNGVEIFNLYSTLKFLQTGEIKNYWKDFNPLQNFVEVLKVPAINKSISMMTRGIKINIRNLEKLVLKDIIGIRNLLINPNLQVAEVVSKYFSLLMEEGYLSYILDQDDSHSKPNNSTAVGIPNDEIKQIFFQALK